MKALFRTDASPEIGSGHVMRCLALAQAWRDLGRGAVFAAAGDLGTFGLRVAKEGLETRRISAIAGSGEDAEQTAAFARDMAAGWVVLDGYHFTSDFAQALRKRGLQILALDDYGHSDHRHANIVLNQNIQASSELYSSCVAPTRLLLGTRYALLRREFWPWRGMSRKVSADARRVLVTFGGSDPLNVTGKVMQALRQVSRVFDLAVKVVIGGANSHASELAALARTMPGKIEVVIDTDNMPSLMDWADVAITAGASTSWELLLLGIPQILLPFAENQMPVAEGQAEQGVAINLGPSSVVTEEQIVKTLGMLVRDPDRRAAMAAKGRSMVDGWGGTRVATAMAEASLCLRPACAEDARLLWDWANEPAVRAASFSTANISWETHVAWLSAKLSNPDCLLLLAAEGDGEPIAQIRFDFSAEIVEIAVSIDSAARGRGWGAAVIGAGVNYVRHYRAGVTQFHAYVKPENQPSLSAFARAGFSRVGDVVRDGTPAIHFTLFA